MTSSIPDSISRDELLRLQVNAEPDFVPEDDYEILEQTQTIMDAVDSVAKKLESVGAYLKTADYSIWVLIQYHQAGYERFKESGNIEQASAYFSDLQRLEELRDTLNTIQVECPDHE